MRQFTCARCGGTFTIDADWTEELAIAEARERFPTRAFLDVRFVLCDECDAAFAKWFATLTEDDKARMEAEYRKA